MLGSMRALLVGCVAVVWLFQASAGVQIIRDVPQEIDDQPSSNIAFPLNFDATNDVAIMFGVEVLQEINSIREDCRLNQTREEEKFKEKVYKLEKYFNETEKVISRPGFKKLSHENREDIEANFYHTFEEMEQRKYTKVNRIQKMCEKKMKRFIKEKLKEAVSYAEDLFHEDISEFEDLCIEVENFALQLRRLHSRCHTRDRKLRFEIAEGVSIRLQDLCRSGDIKVVIKFIDGFLARTDEIAVLYGDDEDRWHLSSGGDDEYANEEGSGTKPPDYEYEEEEEEEEPEPIIILSPQTTTTEVEKATPPTTEEMTDKEKEEIANNFFNSLEPGPVLIEEEEETTPLPDKEKEETTPLPDKESTTTPTPESKVHTELSPELIDKAFEDVNRFKFGDKKPELKDEDGESEDGATKVEVEQEESDSSSRKKSSHRKSGPQIHGKIDLDLPGVDGGVDVEIGPKGVRIDANVQKGAPVTGSIVIDDDHQDNDEEDESSFLTYILTYFFATLGSLLLLTILIVAIAIFAIRSKRRSLKDTALLSEEEKVAVMKQTGYVNPTYKFFDNVDEV